jgi:hypothetical protein
MNYFLLFVVFCLLVLVFFLSFQNHKIRQDHKKSIQKLEQLLDTMYQKQKVLNEKIVITSDYGFNHKIKTKKIFDEIVKLQKVFLEIITNKNNA